MVALGWAFRRFFGMLATPRREWATAGEETGLLRPLCFMVFAILVFRAMRMLMVLAFGLPIVGTKSAAEGATQLGLDSLIFVALGLVGAGVLHLLAPAFSGRRYFPASLGLAAYSMCPAYITPILRFDPFLWPASAALFLYSLVIFWLGLPQMMRCPLQKRTAYFVVFALLTFLAYTLGFIAFAFFHYIGTRSA